MRKLLIGGIAVVAILSATLAGYRLGAGAWPFFEAWRSKPADESAAMNAPSSHGRKVLYWKDPDGKTDFSPEPRKTADGRDYLPVHDDQEANFAEATPKAPPAKAGPRKILYFRNPMGLPDTSPVPKKDWMGMDYIAVYEGEDEDGSSVKVSLEKVQRTGVRSEEVGKRILTRTVRVPGVVALDERRISVIALRFDGYLETVADVTTGTHVKEGQPLMTIYAPELLTIGGKLVVEEETGWRSMAPASRGTGSARELRSPVIGARRRLENMQVPQSYIDEIVKTREVPNTVVWRAPRNGIVLERTAVEGMRAQAGEVLFRIADHSLVWVMAEVPEGDLDALEEDQAVTVRIRAYPGREFHGKVAVVYPHLNKETRTVSARIEMANPELALLPDMYTDVEIVTGADREVVAVPDSAVIDSGARQVVLLEKGDGRFEPREVKLGRHGDGYREVLDGAKAGDRVVTAANFLIDAESNLKAALSAFTADAPAKAEGKP